MANAHERRAIAAKAGDWCGGRRTIDEVRGRDGKPEYLADRAVMKRERAEQTVEAIRADRMAIRRRQLAQRRAAREAGELEARQTRKALTEAEAADFSDGQDPK